MLLVVVPLLPAIGNAVNTNIHISTGLQHLYDFNWLYCFFSSSVAYYVLNLVWPHAATQIPSPIYGVDTLDNEVAAEVDVEASYKERST
jgi:NCS1 family nucleobase:cation symporter-1